MKVLMIVLSICWVESKHKNVINKHDGGSPSYGICQVKLDTANWMKEYNRIPGKPITSKDLMNPDVNVYYAERYLRYQLKVYKNDINCAISAYNAGSCIKGNQKNYVKNVLAKAKEIYDLDENKHIEIPYAPGNYIADL